MKKQLLKVLAVTLGIATILGLSACGAEDDTTTDNKVYEIAVPSDTTNEARALLLLQEQGVIELTGDKGISSTILDVKENPKIKFREVEAAQIPNILQDVDFAVINSNYAISKGLNPVNDSLAIEGSYSAYSNILAVKEGNENTPKIKALVAALESQDVKDFITEKYKGSVVSTVENTTDGYDKNIDYSKLDAEVIKVAASPTPHSEILAIAKEILAKKNITLEIKEFLDYIQPNTVVETGEYDANYFQHLPYLDDFNKENKTHIVSVSAIHVEPMGVYGGKSTDLGLLKADK